jgi:hypothetical protein
MKSRDISATFMKSINVALTIGRSDDRFWTIAKQLGIGVASVYRVLKAA